jgi:hypothetical protein
MDKLQAVVDNSQNTEDLEERVEDKLNGLQKYVAIRDPLEDAIAEAAKYIKVATVSADADLAITIPASKTREFRAMLATLVGSATREVNRAHREEHVRREI